MDQLEFFKKLRDVSNDMVVALEGEDETALATAMGAFLLLMMQADALK